MMELFVKGGPIMWPLLVCSVIAVSVTLERFLFIFSQRTSRQPKLLKKIIALAEQGKFDQAVEAGKETKDFVARTLVYALSQRQISYTNALLTASAAELKHFSRGLAILDTIITLAPLLGLLGTVTGMIHSFGLLGESELGAPKAITGGIAEALIATGFGLGIAITALLPFNYLNSRLEEARHEIEQTGNVLELLLIKCGQCVFRKPEVEISNVEIAEPTSP